MVDQNIGPVAHTFAETYQIVNDRACPTGVTKGVSAADILKEGDGFMGGFDRTFTPAVGCPAGCLYCYDLDESKFLTPKEMKANWGFLVREKKNAHGRFVKALRNGKLADTTIYWSPVTDPYASNAELTRSIWQALLEAPHSERPRRLVVQTRYRADRDAQHIQEYVAQTKPAEGGPPVVVSFSIGTDRDDLIAAWERATPPFKVRMATIERLAQKGICVIPTLSPFAHWKDLASTLTGFLSWRIPFVVVMFFKEHTNSANTPRRFLRYLRAYYPELLDADWQADQLRQVKQIYGDSRVLVGQSGFTALAAPHKVA